MINLAIPHPRNHAWRRSRFSATLAIGLSLTATATLNAYAQGHGIPVFDTTAVAKQLEQIGKLKEQLEQAKELYDLTTQMKDSLNGITDVKDLAKLLNDKKFQQFLPKEYDQFSGSVNDLIKGKTDNLAKKYDYYSNEGEGNTAANDFYHNELKRRKGETYQDMAIGEAVYDQATKRADGLNELKNKLESATTPKEVLDLQARILAESAILQNEINRMQGLAMIQDARNRVDRQRNIEQKNKLIDEILYSVDRNK